MKGDFSRWDIDENKKENFNGVLHQQGRVLTDNDWNAATRITNAWQEQAGQDIIGPGVAAVPAEEPDSFKVVAAEVVNGTSTEHVELDILPGRVWADGLLTFLTGEGNDPTAAVKRTATYLGPPFQDAATDESSIGAGVRDAVILEVWQEAVNGFQIPRQLLEPALGGPDTTERVHTSMAFRLLRLEAGDRCEDVVDKLKEDPAHKGSLLVSLAPPKTVDSECPVEEGGGYTGFEHHLYRIEMAQLDETQLTANGPMFKWSRFNGGLVGRGEFSTLPDKVKITANFQAITTSGLTCFYLETVEYNEDLGHWHVTFGTAATLNADNELDLTGTPFYGTIPASGAPVFFRLWDGIQPTSDFPPSTSASKAKELENGIRLEFDSDTGDNYQPGDYWTFEVRAGGIGNPPITTPIFSLAAALEVDLNNETNTAALQTAFNNNGFPLSVNAVVKLEKAGQWLITDPDKEETYRVCKEAGILNVYHLTLIAYGPPEGILYHRVPLAILEWNAAKKIGEESIHDCRRIFRPLIDQEGCCTFTVGKSGHFDTIQKAIQHLPDSGGQICLLPGIYKENVIIENKKNITINGCYKRTVVMSVDPGGIIFHIKDSQGITLEHMDMEAYGGTAVFMETGTWGQLFEISVAHNRILACINAVRITMGKKITIEDNIIRMLDKEGGDVAIFMHARNSVIQDNDITVVPADDLTPEDTPDDNPVPNPTDPCADLGIIYKYRPLLWHYVYRIWAYVLKLYPVKLFKTPGGIQAAGGSDTIGIYRNKISGGYWNGITLGYILKRIIEQIPGGMNTLKVGIERLPLAIVNDLRKNFNTFIYHLEIEENEIHNMGLNGIGVVSFFSLRDVPVLLTVEDISIYRNNIITCHQQAPTNISATMSQQMAFGGISLADCENLTARENRIENNGTNYPGPVCGIFIQHGEKIDISDNRILNNGPKTLEGRANVLQGVGGGVVIRWSFIRMVQEVIREKTFFTPDGIPAVKIHDNIITQPLGQALLIMAMGPVSVVGNQLTSQGVDSRANAFSLLGGSVVIFNLGVSPDLFTHILLTRLKTMYQTRAAYKYDPNVMYNSYQPTQPTQPAAPGLTATAPDWGKILEVLYYLPGGSVLFSNNQVTLDLRDAEISAAVSSQLIFTLDDISYTGNQSTASGLLDITTDNPDQIMQDSLITDALMLAATIRTNDNRFQEGVIKTFFSLISAAFLMNTCTSNQSTHCLITASNHKPKVHENNVVMYESLFGLKNFSCDYFEKCFETFIKRGDNSCFKVDTPDVVVGNAVAAVPVRTNNSFTQMDALRAEGLEDLQNVHMVKRNSLVREQEILTLEYGDQHPKVMAIQKKIDYTGGMTKDLQVMTAEAKIDEAPVDEKTWRVHGKVFDKDRNGLAGLTVSLYNEKGKWKKQVGYCCTEDNGYFVIDYSPGDAAAGTVSAEEPLFLDISDKNRQKLYRGIDPLFVSPGNVDYRTIMLPTDENGVVIPCPQPEPEPEEPIVPEDQWTVKGLVVDEAGKGIKDATVSLFDKDLLFDNYLGTRITDENGNFEFTFHAEGLKELLEANPDIYLKVMDKAGKVIYTSKKAVKVDVGRIEVLNIKIESSRGGSETVKEMPIPPEVKKKK